MDRSPKGREIEHVEGSPGDIIARGGDILRLGQQMHSCADTLESIKNEALSDGSQKGQAIESLKESIGDSYKKLREAGDLYEPVGPVIQSYGEALEGAQPVINNSADDCVEKWAYYESLPGHLAGHSPAPWELGGAFGPEPGSPQAEREAEQNQAKQAAYDAWLASAQVFDGGYDTWEDAFDTAVDGVSDGLSGSIKDSFWSTLTDILEVAALIIAVAALIIGGPIAAAIALAVGAALLLTTIMSYMNGERSRKDIAFAAVGVIPFGKIVKVSGMSKFIQLTRGGNAGKIANELSGLKSLKGLSTYARDLTTKGKFLETIKKSDGLIGVYSRRGGSNALLKLFTGSERGFTSTYRTYKSFFEGADPALRALRQGKGTFVFALTDFLASTGGTTLKNIKYLNALPGPDVQVSVPDSVKFVMG